MSDTYLHLPDIFWPIRVIAKCRLHVSGGCCRGNQIKIFTFILFHIPDPKPKPPYDNYPCTQPAQLFCLGFLGFLGFQRTLTQLVWAKECMPAGKEAQILRTQKCIVFVNNKRIINELNPIVHRSGLIYSDPKGSFYFIKLNVGLRRNWWGKGGKLQQERRTSFSSRYKVGGSKSDPQKCSGVGDTSFTTKKYRFDPQSHVKTCVSK